MKTQKCDRRSQRTHRLLAEALVSLLHERRYAELTIQDILDRANVGRSTFYTHYWDKDDLLASEIHRVVAVLGSQTHARGNDCLIAIPSLAMFRHVQEQYALYGALTRGQAIELFWTTLSASLCERVEQRFRQTLAAPVDELAVSITAQAVVGTFLTLLKWWLENEMPLPPETVDAYFHQLTLPGVRAVLRVKE